MASSGVASPLDFGAGEWLTVANGLWAAAVPTALRYVNKKDPAFGLVAAAVATGVSAKLDTATKAAAKPAAAKTAPKAAAKKPAAPKK
jgi:hypothetical protein